MHDSYEVCQVKTPAKIHAMRLGMAAVMLILLAANAAAQSGPRLEVGRREWNFGKLWYGDVCSVDVELRNVGNEPLRIANIRSSCGCTTAEPRKRLLEPGESDSITIRYDTTTKKNNVKETITLETNDAIEPELKIQILGEVHHVFDCKPYSGISLGKVAVTTEISNSVTLTNNWPEKVVPKLRPLPPEAPYELELIELEAGVRYRLAAKTKPPLKPGNNHYNIILETGVERLPTMEIGVNAQVLEHVAVWPDVLRVTEVQTTPSDRTLYLYYTPEQQVTITDAKSNIDGVAVRIAGEERPNKYSIFPGYKLTVTLPPFASMPETGAKLEIFTSDPDSRFSKFTVPIEKIHAKHKQPKTPK